MAGVTAASLRKKARALERRYDQLFESMRIHGKTPEAYARLRDMGEKVDAANKALADFLAKEQT